MKHKEMLFSIATTKVSLHIFQISSLEKVDAVCVDLGVLGSTLTKKELKKEFVNLFQGSSVESESDFLQFPLKGVFEEGGDPFYSAKGLQEEEKVFVIPEDSVLAPWGVYRIEQTRTCVGMRPALKRLGEFFHLDIRRITK
ncbi:MAG: hypothetical protein OXB96_00760 [Candidatus Kaiserbacteria bacterium]|nr:hypothetical protein [Candidatus Kaiserbacteria bacterium]